MRTERDWLFKPVLAGYLKAESLIDGTVDLEFLLELHEAMDVKAENDARYQDATRPLR